MRSGDPIRQLARDIAQAPARTQEALQAQIQAQAQTIEADAQSTTTPAVSTNFGSGASVTGDTSQTNVSAEANDLANAAANIGAAKLVGR